MHCPGLRPKTSCTGALSALAIATLLPCAALAQSESIAPRVQTVPTSGMLGFESVRFPGHERVGLASASLLFDVGSNWGVGPAVYAAASGHRGGFFVGGFEVQRRWGLMPGLAIATGLFAGGGGGAGSPVGNGLMLRPALTLLKDIGPAMQLGLSWSSVRFPSGDISSNQIGITLAWRNEFAYLNAPMGSTTSPLSESTGLGFDRMAVTASRYRFTNGPARHIELAGAQAERRTDIPGLTWSLEAAAAAKGDAAGYMELLGAGAFSTAPLPHALPSWRVGVRLAAGLGGGGSVPTGGGLIGKAVATTEIGIAPGWTVGGDYGWLRSANGGMRAQEARVWVGIDLEPGLRSGDASLGHVVRTEWVASVQHHARVLRRDGTRDSLDTIGLALNRYIDDHIYVSGQVHSAFTGGTGAYSVGLVGVGLATSADAPWRAGIEALAGAAGGGTVKSSGGAIGQGMLWAGWRPAAGSEWRAGVGVMRGLGTGGSASPVFQLSWSRAFGMVGR